MIRTIVADIKSEPMALVALAILIIVFLMVWTATPGHAAELGAVPRPAADWLIGLVVVMVIDGLVVLFFRHAHVEGDE